jgi:hypothetical protein
VLGLSRDDGPEKIAGAAGLAVGEVARPSSGPQGARLARRLEAALRDSKCSLVRGPAARIVPGASARVELTSGETLEADAVILATGSLAGRFGVPRAGVALDLESRTNGETSPIAWDDRLRVLGSEGRIVSDGLFVAGDLLEGVDPIRDGLGCAATTGAAAAESALRG